jgi:hypothetical protein
LLSEELRPRAGLPPLLVNLADRPAERLHYLGTSFGLTQPLLAFWRKSAFRPVYIRQTPSDVTGAPRGACPPGLACVPCACLLISLLGCCPPADLRAQPACLCCWADGAWPGRKARALPHALAPMVLTTC